MKACTGMKMRIRESMSRAVCECILSKITMKGGA